MELREVRPLHYITYIDNLPSIFERGLLCWNRAKSIPHRSFALTTVQDRRAAKRVVPGRTVHDYVNLYFNARNATLLRALRDNERLGGNPEAELCVLEISPACLRWDNVMLTDGNAAATLTRFGTVANFLPTMRADLIYAEYRHDLKQVLAVEILVPDIVLRTSILRVLAPTTAVAASVRELGFTGFPVVPDMHMFFDPSDANLGAHFSPNHGDRGPTPELGAGALGVLNQAEGMSAADVQRVAVAWRTWPPKSSSRAAAVRASKAEWRWARREFHARLQARFRELQIVGNTDVSAAGLDALRATMTSDKIGEAAFVDLSRPWREGFTTESIGIGEALFSRTHGQET